MRHTIRDMKFVELSYKIIDQNTGNILIAIEYPISYVHGANDILAPEVLDELKGKSKGDVVEVAIDCNKLYGPRDEGLCGFARASRTRRPLSGDRSQLETRMGRRRVSWHSLSGPLGGAAHAYNPLRSDTIIMPSLEALFR